MKALFIIGTIIAGMFGASAQSTLTEYQFVSSFASGVATDVTGLLWASADLNNQPPPTGSYIELTGVGVFPLDTSAFTLQILPPAGSPLATGGSYTDGVNLFWHTGSSQYQGWAYFSQGNELANGNGIWVPVAVPEPSVFALMLVSLMAFRYSLKVELVKRN
jgi:hypothetical protein